ncbi:UspA domain-containing protein, partial [Haloferax sp. BAB-2207]
MFDQLLFPTDGSDGADAVLDHVVDMAAAHDATLHLLHVAPPEPERRP